MTDENRILIITTKFPPQDFVGVYRMYRLAKNLPRLGWKPYVLTVDGNYEHHENLGLLNYLPEEAEVHRVGYIEPTARGFRMALGGKDRRFAALHQDDGRVSDPTRRPQEASRGGLRRLASQGYRKLYDRWSSNPDLHWTWHRPALKEARRLIGEHNIPLVLTSAPDFTSQRIAAQLQFEGAKWVADFRDPPAYMYRMHSENNSVFLRQREIERHAALHADGITVAAYGIGHILTDMYGLLDDDRIRFIPTGLDVELLSNAELTPDATRPYLFYPGTVTPEYGGRFLEIFAKALEQPCVRETGIRLVIAGNLSANCVHIEPHIDRLGLGEAVEMIGRVPQPEALALLRSALAGVLLTGRQARWWCLHAKAVEYMGMRKRVVALLPELSESRLHLERTGLGIFLDGDRQRAADTLANFILGSLSLPAVNAVECDRFTALRQTEAFANVFECVLSSH